MDQSAGAAEYTYRVPVDGYDSPNECPKYNAKQSDDDTPVLELWGMWSDTLWPSLPRPLWPGVLTTDRVLSMGQIEQNSTHLCWNELFKIELLYT